MHVRELTIETYWTADTRRHHSPKSLLRLKGHWLREAEFTPNAPATVTVRPHCLTITTGGQQPMTQNAATLDDLLKQVRAAVAAQLDAHPDGVYPDQLATTIAEQLAPTDARSLLLLAALDDPELAQRRPWHQPQAGAAEIIKSNLIDRLWEEAARAILD